MRSYAVLTAGRSAPTSHSGTLPSSPGLDHWTCRAESPEWKRASGLRLIAADAHVICRRVCLQARVCASGSRVHKVAHPRTHADAHHHARARALSGHASSPSVYPTLGSPTGRSASAFGSLASASAAAVAGVPLPSAQCAGPPPSLHAARTPGPAAAVAGVECAAAIAVLGCAGVLNVSLLEGRLFPAVPPTCAQRTSAGVSALAVTAADHEGHKGMHCVLELRKCLAAARRIARHSFAQPAAAHGTVAQRHDG